MFKIEKKSSLYAFGLVKIVWY